MQCVIFNAFPERVFVGLGRRERKLSFLGLAFYENLNFHFCIRSQEGRKGFSGDKRIRWDEPNG
jgi:hypothetical protein